MTACWTAPLLFTVTHGDAGRWISVEMDPIEKNDQKINPGNKTRVRKGGWWGVSEILLRSIYGYEGTANPRKTVTVVQW